MSLTPLELFFKDNSALQSRFRVMEQAAKDGRLWFGRDGNPRQRLGRQDDGAEPENRLDAGRKQLVSHAGLVG